MVGLIVDFTWCMFRFDGYAVVYLSFIVTPVVCVSFCFMHAFCYAVRCALSSFAIILLSREERAGCFTFVTFYVLCFCSRFPSTSLCYILVCRV